MGKFDKRLGIILVKRGLLAAEQRDTMLSEEGDDDSSLVEQILSQELMAEDELIGAISAETNLPPINLSKVEFDTEALELMDEKTARDHSVLPIARIGNTLTLAVADPSDVITLDHIEQVTGSEIMRVVSTDVAIQKGIERAYAEMKEQEGALEQMGEMGELAEIEDLVSAIEMADEEAEALEDDAPSEHDNDLIRLVNKMIYDAHRLGATDIHVEPYPGRRVDVRCRIDGEMRHLMKPLPPNLRKPIVTRIKIMANLDIAEHRISMSGKIRFKPLNIELRVETIPTTAGDCEDVVLRILAAGKPIPLENMGFSERNISEFIKLVQIPYGIFLCVGPTGSGKTTTLHSALGYINKVERKIWTAEDPIEITQDGLRQCQVNRKANQEFPQIMRSFLRADPDVIMIGEMRDPETAKMGIEASLTGHLVFSTLHTNSAPETIVRLLDMGIDTFTFADSLLGVLAQRLVRSLCKECKEDYHPDEDEYQQLKDDYLDDELWKELNVPESGELTLKRIHPGGCSKCDGTGERGRYGVHELMLNSPQIKDLIYASAKAEDIRKAAIAEGMRTLRQDGVAKVLQGITTMDRVRRVCSR